MAVSARTDLVLVFHNHQPIGNFPKIFRAAFDGCYRHLLDEIIAHPEIRVGLHHSGPLFEWLIREEPGYMADLKALVERAQVEIVGGGFYEPMLVMLNDEDSRGQIEMMSAFVNGHLNTTPRGIWLAERVWDPELPRALAPAGAQYVLLDDSHLMGAGLIPPVGQEISGYYVTERAGCTVAVFPISRTLRYAIPFQSPEKVINTVLEAGNKLSESGQLPILTYGDDGEKFGMWPGTKELVKGQGWLKSFFSLLQDNSDKINTTTPSAVLARHPCSGRVYIPNAAYEEMDAWVLPTESARRLQEVREAARKAPADSALGRTLPFLRGGVWAGFLAKYPEANRMHKKMVQVSHKLREAYVAQRTGALYGEADVIQDRLATAQRELYAGQCCCAYWHGWFGGIYLNYLRHAVLERLLRAEVLLDSLLLGPEEMAGFERTDFDGDLADEALLFNSDINAYATPAQGGALFAFDDRQNHYPLLNVLARHQESYHSEFEDQNLVYDTCSRLSFVDRFYTNQTNPAQIRDNPKLDLGTFANSAYALVEIGRRDDIEDGVEAVLRADGTVTTDLGQTQLRIGKRYLVPKQAAAVQVVYTITHEQGAALDCLFAPELNLALLSAEGPERYLLRGDDRLGPADTGILEGTDEISLVDETTGLAVVVSADGCNTFWHYPIETLSRGDSRPVRSYQGTAIHPVFELSLKPGEVCDLEVVLGLER